MPSITVSVVIPAFNRPGSTVRALRSVLMQSGVPLEAILVDDASDPPLALPDDLAAHPRVSLLRHQVNRGPAAARNTGILAARGRWIAFLDSDDEFLPGKLAAQLAVADEGAPLSAVASAFRYVRDSRSDDMLPVESGSLSDFCSGCWHCPGSTALIAREAFDRIGLLDPALRRLEDVDWFIRLAQAGGSLRVARHLGATISVGANATVPNVDAAACAIAAKFGPGGAERDLPSACRRDLAAYLALERAAARIKSGRYVGGLGWLVRSFWIRPRLGLQLRSWWRPLR